MVETSSTTQDLRVQLTACWLQIGSRGWYVVNGAGNPLEYLIIRGEGHFSIHEDTLHLSGTEIMARFIRRNRTSSGRMLAAKPIQHALSGTSSRVSTPVPTATIAQWEPYGDRPHRVLLIEPSRKNDQAKRLRLDHPIHMPKEVDESRKWHIELTFSHMPKQPRILTISPNGIEF
jgi:hypothetical protein